MSRNTGAKRSPLHDVLASVTRPTDDGFVAEWGDHTVRAVITEDGGVFQRRDSLLNTGSTPLTLTHYRSRFALPGDAYDVYTQQSFWQNESRGAWAPLVTEVSVTSGGMYTSREGAPMLALWNRQSQRGIVFQTKIKSERKLILDFSKVSFMDSTGIGMLLGRYNKFSKQDINLYIKNPTSYVNRIFEMTGIYQIIPKVC